MSEQELLASIRGEFKPTPAVRLGLAFGKILEDPDAYRVPGGYRYGDYSFDEATMAPAFAIIDRQGIFEAKALKRYGDCDVVSKADHLIGAHLSEFKTTCSTFNFDKYADSCQWRLMVDAFEALKVTYHVFLLDDHENGVAELRGVESFNLYPYPDLHQDCRALVREFAAYVTARGLDGLLRKRQQEAA